ncbi:MAG: anti-sigma F factor [Clostridiales bacterium]|nr:anti-sigma F factor [Clostridiales bacterium]
MKNEITLEFDAVSVNEGFARVAVAAFITSVNPTIEEISDVKTALSEAVTNAIIHGYEEKEGKVRVVCLLEGDRLTVEVKDKGKGIENVERAMEPLYTTKPELERSGMGFAFMEAFMDELEVESAVGEGTTVRMRKKLGTESYLGDEE